MGFTDQIIGADRKFVLARRSKRGCQKSPLEQGRRIEDRRVDEGVLVLLFVLVFDEITPAVMNDRTGQVAGEVPHLQRRARCSEGVAPIERFIDEACLKITS